MRRPPGLAGFGLVKMMIIMITGSSNKAHRYTSSASSDLTLSSEVSNSTSRGKTKKKKNAKKAKKNQSLSTLSSSIVFDVNELSKMNQSSPSAMEKILTSPKKYDKNTARLKSNATLKRQKKRLFPSIFMGIASSVSAVEVRSRSSNIMTRSSSTKSSSSSRDSNNVIRSRSSSTRSTSSLKDPNNTPLMENSVAPKPIDQNAIARNKNCVDQGPFSNLDLKRRTQQKTDFNHELIKSGTRKKTEEWEQRILAPKSCSLPELFKVVDKICTEQNSSR